MPTRLRVLLIEDSEDDARAVARILSLGGYDPALERVDAAESLRAALDRGGEWDVVLCDYALPGFSAPEALQMVQAVDPDLPFIVVSGTIGEQHAVHIARRGAHAFVHKDELARLPPVIERELSEARIRAERRRAEAGLELLLKQLPAVMWSVDRNLRLTHAPGTEQLTGRTLHEVFGTADETHVSIAAHRRALAGETVSFEVRWQGTDFQACVRPLRSPQGEISGAVGAALNITEQRSAERAAEENAGTLRALLDAAGDPVFLLDAQLRFVAVNEALARSFGKPAAALVGTPALPHLTGDIARSRAARLHEVLTTGRAVRFEDFNPANGRWFDNNVFPVFDDAGRPFRLAVFARDITDAKKQEQSLRDALEFNKQIVAGAFEGIVVLDRSLHFRVFNPYLERLTGVPAGAVVGTHPLELFPFLRPTGMWDRIERALAGDDVIVPEYPFEIAQTGKSGWAAIRLGPLRDSTGSIVGVLGMVEDITDRKRAEEALRASEARFRRLAECGVIGVIRADIHGRIVDANDEFLRMSGYNRAEMPMRWDAITPPEFRALDERAIEELKATGIARPWEKEYIRKDGGRVPVLVGVGMLDDASGDCMAFVLDITERKRAESALRQVAVGVSAGTGSEFFEALTLHLAGLFDADYAFIGLLDEKDPQVVNTLATCARGAIVANMNYHLRDTPCAQVVGQTTCHHPRGVQKLFPKDELLAQMGVEGYIGTPLFTAEGRPLGLIVVLSTKPLQHGEPVREILEIFGARAAAELQRKVAEEKVRESAARLRDLSRRLMEVQEAERRFLARELHDQVGQLLTAMKIQCHFLKKEAAGTSAEPRAAETAATLDTAIQLVRTLSLELRPTLLDDLGLSAALRWQLDRQALAVGLGAEYVEDPQNERAPAPVEVACFRIAQEAINNILRHARASKVRVELRRRNGELHLSIRDDGVGFDPIAAVRHAAGGGSMGLLGMTERAELLGGRVEFHSSPGEGSEVRAVFALKSEE